MQKQEIERRYLLKPVRVGTFLKRHGIEAEKETVRQYYVEGEGENPPVRYRKNGKRCRRTVKRGRGLVRMEEETEIPCREYRRHFHERTGNEIRKKRYRFSYRGREYELDRFAGRLKGLYILELEFENVEEAGRFRLPGIFESIAVAEVTELGYFNNISLCRLSGAPALRLEDLGETESCSAFMPAGEVLRRQMIRLAESIRENAQELYRSDDPECLHRFRIAQRQMRVWLEALGKLPEGDWSKKQLKCLGRMMKQSNAARDLDVMVQMIGKYRSDADPTEREELTLLEESLRREKKRHLALMQKSFGSEEFRKCMEALSPGAVHALAFTPEAERPIVLLLMERLEERWNRLRTEVSLLDAGSGVKVYHRLRIGFKKQRYLLELSRDLTDRKRAGPLLKAIRKILGDLGELHDLSVEMEILRGIDPAKRLPAYDALYLWMKKRRGRLKEKSRRRLRRFFRRGPLDLNPYVMIR